MMWHKFATDQWLYREKCNSIAKQVISHIYYSYTTMTVDALRVLTCFKLLLMKAHIYYSSFSASLNNSSRCHKKVEDTFFFALCLFILHISYPSVEVSIFIYLVQNYPFQGVNELSLHMACGHPFLVASWIQAPRNFFCRVSSLLQYTFPLYVQALLAMKSSISGLSRNQCWACLFVMWHSWTSSILIPKILLIDMWWNALIFFKTLSVMLQDLAPHSSAFIGPPMYIQYLPLVSISLHEKTSFNIPIWVLAFLIIWLILLFHHLSLSWCRSPSIWRTWWRECCFSIIEWYSFRLLS